MVNVPGQVLGLPDASNGRARQLRATGRNGLRDLGFGHADRGADFIPLLNKRYNGADLRHWRASYGRPLRQLVMYPSRSAFVRIVAGAHLIVSELAVKTLVAFAP